VIFFAFLTLANLAPESVRAASPLLPDKGLRLGLDLQGGIHWVLGVKLDEAEKQELGFLAENLRQSAKDGARFHSRVGGARGRQAGRAHGERRDRSGVRSWARKPGSRSRATRAARSASSCRTPRARRCASAAWRRCSRCCGAGSPIPCRASRIRW
jgi:hypothetical protein